MAMLYLEMKADVGHFLNYSPDGLNKKATGILNKAVRYIQNFYQGRWRHLFIRDNETTLDSTGKIIALPSDLNHLELVARLTRGRHWFKRDTDYYIDTASPSDLTSAVTKQIKFWFAQTPNQQMFLSYWRLWKEFADSTTEQYPDIPESGDAIWKTARYLGLVEDEGANNNDILFWKREAEQAIRDLKCVDSGYDTEDAPPLVDINNDVYEAEYYSHGDGGMGRQRFNPVKPIFGD